MGQKHTRRHKRPVLAICGGGNAGHALAVIASQRFDGDVTWLVGSEQKADILRAGVFSREGLTSTGKIEGAATRVVRISADASEVIPRAEIVLIAVPAYLHAPILRQIAPHLRPDTIVGSLPARSGFEFEATAILGPRAIFGLQTLPWSTRVQIPGTRCNFGSIKSRVLMAALPASRTADIAERMTALLGTQMVPTQNFLNITLGNPGQVIHPGLMYGLFKSWDGRPFGPEAVPHFYAHTTEESGEFVGRLSREIGTAAAVIQARAGERLDLSGVNYIHEWLRMSYATQTADLSTIAACFRTGPLQMRKAPVLEITPGAFVPNFAYRYLSEDVPFGLAIAKAIAQIAGAPTPAIDELLLWAQDKLAKHYLRSGEISGADAVELPTPQNYGVTSVDALIGWYVRENAAAPLASTGA